MDLGSGIEIDGSNLYCARPFFGLPLAYRGACEQQNFLFPDWDRRHRQHLLPDRQADRPMGQQSARIAPLRLRQQLRRPRLDIRRPGGKRIRLKREGSRPERFGIRLRAVGRHLLGLFRHRNIFENVKHPKPARHRQPLPGKLLPGRA